MEIPFKKNHDTTILNLRQSTFRWWQYSSIQHVNMYSTQGFTYCGSAKLGVGCFSVVSLCVLATSSSSSSSSDDALLLLLWVLKTCCWSIFPDDFWQT